MSRPAPLTGMQRRALLYRVRDDLRTVDRLMHAGCHRRAWIKLGMVELRLTMLVGPAAR